MEVEGSDDFFLYNEVDFFRFLLEKFSGDDFAGGMIWYHGSGCEQKNFQQKF